MAIPGCIDSRQVFSLSSSGGNFLLRWGEHEPVSTQTNSEEGDYPRSVDGLATNPDRRLIGILKYLSEGAAEVEPESMDHAAPASVINNFVGHGRDSMKYWYNDVAAPNGLIEEVTDVGEVDEHGSNVWRLLPRGEDVLEQSENENKYPGEVDVGEVKEDVDEALEIVHEVKLASQGHGATLEDHATRLDELEDTISEVQSSIGGLEDQLQLRDRQSVPPEAREQLDELDLWSDDMEVLMKGVLQAFSENDELDFPDITLPSERKDKEGGFG